MADKQKPYPVAPGMAHGYYLAALDLCCGEPVLSEGARVFYSQLGLDPKHAGRYDGCSVFTRGAELVVRLCLQNFFCEQLDVRVHDSSMTSPMTHKIDSCPCGGKVYLRQPDGGDFLTIRYKGNIAHMPMPQSMLIPKCTTCQEVYLGYSLAREIAVIMGGELAE